MFYTVLQIIIPVYLLWYGYKLRFKTPEFKDKRGSISTWRTRSDKAEWIAGNRFGGGLCMTYAVVLAVICSVKHLICGIDTIPAFNYIFAALVFVCVFSLVPLTHAMLAKRFGKKEYVNDDPGASGPPPRSGKSSGGKKHKKKKKK